MVRSARLKFALLTAGVVVGHLVALEWIARETEALTGLKAMAPPMYTRLLKPATPPPVVATAAQPAPPPPKPKSNFSASTVRAAPPKPAASSPEELARARELTLQRALDQVRKLDEERRLAQQREEERQRAEQAAQQAQAAASAASAPLAAASAQAAVDRWPADSRLSYDVTGMYRGPLQGNANVQWQREGDKYQVRLQVNVSFITQDFTSQGQVTPGGLVPHDYEELRNPGHKRRITRIGEDSITLDNGTKLPRPPGVQDTASQFVELAERFALGKEKLEVGRSVSVWLARPGGVDEWIYDIVDREMLKTPMGEVEAFHLKPRAIPIPRGNISAEMWFAPSLQYLPVKIRVVMGDEAWLDLMVTQIEQR